MTTATATWEIDRTYAHDLVAQLNELLDDGFEPDDAVDIIWNRHDNDRLHYDEEWTFSLDGEDLVTFDITTERFTAE